METVTDLVRSHALLVAGGPLSDADVDLLRRRLAVTDRETTLIVGVDAGASHLWRLGTVPDLVTGDFDSTEPELRSELAARGSRIVHTPDQDFTDLDKALAVVREERVLSADVFAATGGRLDHTYSVISAIIKHGRTIRIRLVDALGRAWLVDGRAEIKGANMPGRTQSLLALGPCTGVTTTGVRWPLTNETLAPGVRDGTLNEIIADSATIRVAAGNLLVYLPHIDGGQRGYEETTS